MRARTGSGRWAVAVVALLAVVFAPAATEGMPRSDTAGPVGARLLAPSMREAIVAVGPKLTSQYQQLGVQRSRPEWVSVPASAAAALILVWASLAAGFAAARCQRLIEVRALIPRGPPALGTK